MAIMLLIAGGATTALLKMTGAQATIWNRTQMHSGIRGATEVLQQEVGQAGRVALPAAVTLTAPITAPSTTAQSVNVSSTAGMFQGQRLLIDAGFPAAAVNAVPPKGAAADDLLDALACAAIARRIRAGDARPFPDPSQCDAFGLPMAIWA